MTYVVLLRRLLAGRSSAGPRGAVAARRGRRLSEEALAVRARAGDASAARQLRSRLRGDITRMALILTEDPQQAMSLARQALNAAAGAGDASGPPAPRALAMAVLRRPESSAPGSGIGRRSARSLDERLQQAVIQLCDGQGMSQRHASAQLGISLPEVARLHQAARAVDGDTDAAEPRCAGWSLVRRLDALTASEVTAAESHMGMCRDCRDAHSARVRARRQLQLTVPAAGVATVGGVWGAVNSGVSAVGGAAAAGTAAAAVGGLLLLIPHAHDPWPGDRPVGGNPALTAAARPEADFSIARQERPRTPSATTNLQAIGGRRGSPRPLPVSTGTASQRAAPVASRSQPLAGGATTSASQVTPSPRNEQSDRSTPSPRIEQSDPTPTDSPFTPAVPSVSSVTLLASPLPSLPTVTVSVPLATSENIGASVGPTGASVGVAVGDSTIGVKLGP